MKPRMSLALAAAMLAACAPGSSSHRVAGPLASPLALRLEAGAFTRPFWLSQAVSGNAQGQTHAARFEVQYDDQGLIIAALSAGGLPFFTIRDGAKGVEFETKLASGRGLKPEWILNDFLAAYLPATALEPQLAAQGYRLAETGNARRILAPDGPLYLEIRYQSTQGCRGDVRIDNARLGYRLDIRLLGGECAW